MKGVFRAVLYLHDRDYVHRDLKPENILITDTTDFSTVKIADFGLAA
jgi:serine/threonine protein kinase